MRKMQAIAVRRFGTPDEMRLEEVDTPAPADDQALVRVRASSVNPYDWHILTGLPKLFRPVFGFRGPRKPILGADFAGVIEAIGSAVTDWAVGDEVYGQKAAGAFAEYLTIGQEYLVAKPSNLTFEQAAAMPLAGTTALQAMRDHGEVQAGQTVLINGASGGVGTFAVQIAAHLGAEVTGVCSTRNVEMVRSLGASHVVDYTQQDFTRTQQRYDLILDLVGNRSVSDLRRSLQPKGRYVASHGQPEKLWLGPVGWLIRMKLVSLFVGQKLKSFTAKAIPADWRHLKELAEEGALRPVIDRTYPLAEVSDAFRYAEQWHARGKVIITI